MRILRANKKTIVLRLLALFGAFSGGLWLIGGVWDIFFHEPPITALVATTVLFVLICTGGLFFFAPSTFHVRDDITWVSLMWRLAIGIIISYPILVLLVGLLSALGLLFAGISIEGEYSILVFALAFWLPLWFLPLSGSFVAWLWSRKVENQLMK